MESWNSNQIGLANFAGGFMQGAGNALSGYMQTEGNKEVERIKGEFQLKLQELQNQGSATTQRLTNEGNLALQTETNRGTAEQQRLINKGSMDTLRLTGENDRRRLIQEGENARELLKQEQLGTLKLSAQEHEQMKAKARLASKLKIEELHQATKDEIEILKTTGEIEESRLRVSGEEKRKTDTNAGDIEESRLHVSGAETRATNEEGYKHEENMLKLEGANELAAIRLEQKHDSFIKFEEWRQLATMQDKKDAQDLAIAKLGEETKRAAGVANALLESRKLDASLSERAVQVFGEQVKSAQQQLSTLRERLANTEQPPSIEEREQIQLSINSLEDQITDANRDIYRALDAAGLRISDYDRKPDGGEGGEGGGASGLNEPDIFGLPSVNHNGEVNPRFRPDNVTVDQNTGEDGTIQGLGVAAPSTPADDTTTATWTPNPSTSSDWQEEVSGGSLDAHINTLVPEDEEGLTGGLGHLFPDSPVTPEMTDEELRARAKELGYPNAIYLTNHQQLKNQLKRKVARGERYESPQTFKFPTGGNPNYPLARAGSAATRNADTPDSLATSAHPKTNPEVVQLNQSTGRGFMHSDTSDHMSRMPSNMSSTQQGTGIQGTVRGQDDELVNATIEVLYKSEGFDYVRRNDRGGWVIGPGLRDLPESVIKEFEALPTKFQKEQFIKPYVEEHVRENIASVKGIVGDEAWTSMDSTRRSALTRFVYWHGAGSAKGFEDAMGKVSQGLYIDAYSDFLDSITGRDKTLNRRLVTLALTVAYGEPPSSMEVEEEVKKLNEQIEREKETGKKVDIASNLSLLNTAGQYE